MSKYFNDEKVGRRLLLSISLLLLTACGGTPDTRARPLIDAETYLNAGTNAFYNDEYVYANEKFDRALQLYQSVDHLPGIIDSLINLTETSIALGQFASAEKQLDKLRNLQKNLGEQSIHARLTLLQVKLLSRQKQYAAAIALLSPLLPAFDPEQNMIGGESHSLNSIASMAHLANAANLADSALWLERFEIALNARENPPARSRALMLRLQAQQRLASGELQRGEDLLRQALLIYQQIPYRRGIAITLQQLARAAIMRDDAAHADALLERSLRIHQWTLNRGAARDVLLRLIDLNRQLGRTAQVETYQAQLAELDRPG